MKRLIVSIIIMSVMLISSGFMLYSLYETKSNLIVMLDEIKVHTENGDYDTAYSKTLYFCEHWEYEEARLIRYIRHSQIDSITGTVAKLPSLIKYEEYGEFLSEVDQIKVMVEHIWKSELPIPNNIL